MNLTYKAYRAKNFFITPRILVDQHTGTCRILKECGATYCVFSGKLFFSVFQIRCCPTGDDPESFVRGGPSLTTFLLSS